MIIKDIVLEMKDGNYDNFDYLVNYYYATILSKPAFSNSTENEKQELKKIIGEIIIHYFKNDLKSHFIDYMSHSISAYVKKLNKKPYNPYEYYTNIINDEIKKQTSVLNEQQARALAGKIYLVCEEKHKKANDKTYLSSFIDMRINYLFSCDKANNIEDKILILYAYYFGVFDNVRKYFFEKYSLIASKLGVSYNDGDFDSFIAEFFSRKNILYCSIENNMQKHLKSLGVNKTLSNDYYEAKKDKNIAKKYYSYIKDYIYQKHEKQFEDKKLLRKIIDIKFDYIIDVYFQKEHKSHLTKFVNTYLNNYILRLCKLKNKTENIVLLYAGNYVGSASYEEIKRRLEQRKNEALYEYYVDNLNCESVQFSTYLKNALNNVLYLDEQDVSLSDDKKGHLK